MSVQNPPSESPFCCGILQQTHNFNISSDPLLIQYITDENTLVNGMQIIPIHSYTVKESKEHKKKGSSSALHPILY